MASARSHPIADQTWDIGGAVSVDQVTHILFGGKAHHHAQAVLVRDVEQIARRCCVRNPDRIDIIGRHQGEIAIDHGVVMELTTIAIRSKGPVGYAAHIEFLVAEKEKFPADARSQVRR